MLCICRLMLLLGGKVQLQRPVFVAAIMDRLAQHFYTLPQDLNTASIITETEPVFIIFESPRLQT